MTKKQKTKTKSVQKTMESLNLNDDSNGISVGTADGSSTSTPDIATGLSFTAMNAYEMGERYNFNIEVVPRKEFQLWNKESSNVVQEFLVFVFTSKARHDAAGVKFDTIELKQKAIRLDQGGVFPDDMSALKTQRGAIETASLLTEQSDLYKDNRTSVDSISLANICNIETKKLKISRFSKLTKGVVNVGSVVWVTIAAPSCKLTAVQLLVRDDDGVACMLSLYNVMDASAKTADVQMRFPEGMRFALKNPYLKCFTSGFIGLRNDNPCNLDFHQPELKGLLAVKMSSSSVGPNPESLKLRGNELFKSKNFEASVDMYTQALHTIDMNDVSMVGLQTVLHSNIAACHLKTGQFMRAKHSAQAALSLTPTHVKAMFRLAEALFGLRNYEEALNLFVFLKNQGSISEADCMAKFEQGREKFMQAETAITTKSLQHDVHNQIEDYFGPVEVRATGNRGRGLFVTKDVCAGTVLMVEKAFVCVFQPAHSKIVSHAVNHSTSSIMQGTKSECVAQATMKVHSSKLANYRFSMLYDGSVPNTIVPDMCVFKQDDEDVISAAMSDYHSTSQLSAMKVSGIITTNCFGESTRLTENPFDKDNTAVYLVISFMNHADKTQANTHRDTYGDVMRVLASRDIPRGGEIFTSYVETGNAEKDKEVLKAVWGIGK